MARILVAEDSPTQLAEISFLLRSAGYEVETAADGKLALAALEQHTPDLVLTDMDMPNMNGLQLVAAVCEDHPGVPVVLMTAYGNEQVAIEALERGAASYVPKRNLAHDLIESIKDVLSVVEDTREQERVAGLLVQTKAHFVLENDLSALGPVVARLQEAMQVLGVVDAAQAVRVGVALEEALRNALFHGNLELTSQQLRDAYHLEDGGQSYAAMLEERRSMEPFRDRRIHVKAHITPREATCSIRDDGPGFDSGSLPRTDQPGGLQRDDRGWVLIRTFMDQVTFNAAGNEIILTKQRTAS